MAALILELPNLVFTGTLITLDTLAVNIAAVLVEGSIVYYNSLAVLPIANPLPSGGYATLAAALDMYCAADLNIPIDELEVTIWLQEEINVDG